LETPFFKYNDSEKKYSKKDIKNLYEEMNIKDKMLNHIENFIDIKKEQIIKEMLSIKTKFNEDVGDTREAVWVKDENHYSIFCGKISAICSISEEIINDIGI
jgi:CRISPR/Cas system-associated protein Cas10 (large subunit of type III CRISPR-Cas system)